MRSRTLAAGRFSFTMEVAAGDCHCGRCRRKIKKGDIRVGLGGRYTFDTLICRRCCGVLTDFFDRASWIRTDR